MKSERPTKGSFGIPDDVKKAVDESKAKAKNASVEKKTYTDSESIPEEEAQPDNSQVPPAEAEAPKVEVEKKKTPAEIAAEFKKELGIELTEDDMWAFLFKGKLKKEGIVIIPGMMTATFQTINLDQTQAIDEHLAKELEKNLLDQGFRTLQTRHVLSQGLVTLGKPGEKQKSLGETPEHVFKALGTMPSLLVEKISQKWNKFVFLVDFEVNKSMETTDGKNS